MANETNFNVDQGADFSVEIDITDINDNAYDLTSHTVAGTIKKTYTSSTSYTFTGTVEDASGGTIKLVLTNIVTASMASGRYVYDVELTDTSESPDIITRILEGQVDINPSVT
jgi:hypothetical protein